MYGCFCSPQCVTAFNFDDLNDNVIINYKTFLEAGYMEQNMKEKMERDERQGGNEGEARKAISVAMIANNSVH